MGYMSVGERLGRLFGRKENRPIGVDSGLAEVLAQVHDKENKVMLIVMGKEEWDRRGQEGRRVSPAEGTRVVLTGRAGNMMVKVADFTVHY